MLCVISFVRCVYAHLLLIELIYICRRWEQKLEGSTTEMILLEYWYFRPFLFSFIELFSFLCILNQVE